MNFYSILRSIKKSPRLGRIRPYLNLLYYDPSTVIISHKNFDTVTVDGFSFYVNDQIDSIQRVRGNPWFEGVRPTDTVLDIGANIGAIAIPLAKTAKTVYAVEPLFWKELRANIKLNNLENIKVIQIGVGTEAKGRLSAIEFSSKKAMTVMLTFAELLEITSKIDFVKIDGEGCEWDIEPEQLAGVREIRIEFHIRRASKKKDEAKFTQWLDWLDREDYEVYTSYGKPPLCVPFCACLLLRASKRE